jgi:hypothetical protein
MSLLLASLLVFWIAGIPILVLTATATLPRVLRGRERAPVAPVAQLFPAREASMRASAAAELHARR